MFRGINVLNIEAKGRFAMPTRYREQLDQETLIATIDTEEHCLLLYPIKAWEEIEAKLAKLPSFDPQARRVQRLLIGHATELEFDGQGRLLIPTELRDYAGIEKKIVLLGQSNKFEIWSEEVWQARRTTWIEEQGKSDMPEDLKNISL
ncbi:MAG: division/cell wall cluster transcriptional repressor MraZ [Pseudomonadota bacterium]